MSEELEAARRYRFHGEELRTIAADMSDPKSRETVLKIANDYDRMALTMEAIDRTNRTLQKDTAPRQ
jgi:hypothetical protein